MPLDAYPWSARYASVQDRFGVSWQVITGQRSAHGDTVVPCLMFANGLHGRAAEALRFYAEAFPGGEVTALEHYGPGEGPAHTIKHGRAVLAGQELIAMDTHGEHGFTFDEELSLQVMCADQAAVDHFWQALSSGGSTSVCGWLKDRFGVSWQVVPTAIAEWMTSGDVAARDRAFGAMMKMTKPDIAALEAALRGD